MSNRTAGSSDPDGLAIRSGRCTNSSTMPANSASAVLWWSSTVTLWADDSSCRITGRL